MDLHDFYTGLKEGPSDATCDAFVADLVKESGAKETVLRAIMDHKKPLIGAAAGAASLGLATLKFTKPGKDGKSEMQSSAEEVLENAKLKQKAQKARLGKTTFSADMDVTKAMIYKALADTYAKNPTAAVISTSTTGAKAGWSVAQQLIKFGLV